MIHLDINCDVAKIAAAAVEIGLDKRS